MRLVTGQGYWSPLIWLALAAGVAFFGWQFWRLGRRPYKAGTDQDAPFLSGEAAPEGAHVGGHHLYWGFLQGLRPALEALRAFHSGFLGDYLTWTVVVVGGCGCASGVFYESYNVLGPVDEIVPVDVYVPGCPPRPEAIIDGVVKAVAKLERLEAGEPV